VDAARSAASKPSKAMQATGSRRAAALK
jgi:hypothetical protein